MCVVISIFIFFLNAERSGNMGKGRGRDLSKPVLKIPFDLYGSSPDPTEHSWSQRGCPGVGKGGNVFREWKLESGWGFLCLDNGAKPIVERNKSNVW